MAGVIFDTAIIMKILLLIIIALTCTLGLANLAGAGNIVVITAGGPKQEAPAEKISRKTIEKIYMKRKFLWKNGKRIVPINLPASAPIREVFTKAILKRDHRTLVEYWNGKHFSGINPPVILKSEEAVKRFLRKVPGSVGYISAENIEADLRVIYTIKEKRAVEPDDSK